MQAKNSNVTFTIGQVAKLAAVNTQTLRYYERAGILSPNFRSPSGYRKYDLESFRKLKFIKQAQQLGFELKEIKEFLQYRISTPHQCEHVRFRAEKKLKTVQEKIDRLCKLKQSLKALIASCDSRQLSDQCPVIEKMSQI